MNPAQKQALLQLAESIVISACIAALTAVLPLVTGDGTIDWRVVGIVGGTGFLVSLAHSAAAYLRQSAPNNTIAPTDQVSLADLIDALADGLSKKYATRPINTPTTPVAQPQTPTYPNIPMSSLPPLSSLVTPSTVPLQGGIENETTVKRPAL